MAEQGTMLLSPGTELDERYRLERLVGAGGMATVWRAKDEVLGRRVAIKVMSDALAADEASVARFGREALIAARISHANLVKVYDFSAEASQPYLVMEYLDGGTLAERVRGARLAGSQVRDLACDLLSAIDRIHDEGVLHRDIKPANVLLGSDGRARLSDFGIARLEDATRLTQPGHIVGTLRYIAPEVVEGAPASRRSDLYSLGVLLREISSEDDLDASLRAVIDRLTERDPTRRPHTAGEVLVQLRATPAPMSATNVLLPPQSDTNVLLQPQSVTNVLTGVPPYEATFRTAQRNRLLVGGAAALLALVVVIVIATGGGSHHTGSTSAGSRGSSTTAIHSLSGRLDQLEQSVRALAAH